MNKAKRAVALGLTIALFSSLAGDVNGSLTTTGANEEESGGSRFSRTLLQPPGGPGSGTGGGNRMGGGGGGGGAGAGAGGAAAAAAATPAPTQPAATPAPTVAATAAPTQPAATQPAATPAPTQPAPTPAPTAAATPAPTAAATPAATQQAAVVPQQAAAAAPKAPITDRDVFNLALNLEYLEANFYWCAVYGTPINQSMWLGGPAPTGCTKGNFSAPVLALLTEIAQDEVAHVTDIQQALGTGPNGAVPMPQIDLGGAFAAAVARAFNQTALVPAFGYAADDASVLAASFFFEDVGVTAYLGAMPLISSKTLLDLATGILGVEGYHAGAIRSALSNIGASKTTANGATVTELASAISAFREALSQAAKPAAADLDQGLTKAVNGVTEPNIFPTGSDGLILARTTEQTGGKGGFLPAGLNGAIAAA
ncbi:hypothetical protein WJX72_009870 [[Myrmecia] bisecta]|uniref:Uncharacterized protein n=1 Tax=[Myrmecia] bisecta TaxID=41462 RepID=A0AAW1R912_9CHLO